MNHLILKKNEYRSDDLNKFVITSNLYLLEQQYLLEIQDNERETNYAETGYFELDSERAAREVAEEDL